MKTIVVAAGAIAEVIATVPGAAYSVYVGKRASSGPSAGTLVLSHDEPDEDQAVLDGSGMAVTADLASVDGIAVTFVAHAYALRITGSGMSDGDRLAFSVIPVR